MLTYLLIIFVIAIALAPLTSLMPSKRQREIARMREYAAVHGLFVEFRGVPGRDSGRIRSRDSAGHDTIYYGKHLPPAKQKKPEQSRAWLSGAEGWVGLERRLAVPESLAHLPAQVLAASVDEGSCGIYWRESGGVEAVEQIRQVLEAWAGQLRA
jgi:hypothetical protein